MKTSLKQSVVLSNDAHFLKELLISHLSLQDGNKKWLIIPSKLIKIDLFEYWAIQYGGCGGIKTFSLMGFLGAIVKSFANKQSHFPSIFELSVLIENLFISGKIDEKPFPKQWLACLRIIDTSLINEKKVATSIFIEIALELTHAKLYEKKLSTSLEMIALALEKLGVCLDFDHLLESLELPSWLECHFYGFLSLPKAMHHFLEKLATNSPQTFYFCTPTSHHLSTVQETILSKSLQPLQQTIGAFEKVDIPCEVDSLLSLDPRNFEAYEKKIFNEYALRPNTKNRILNHVKSQMFFLPDESIDHQMDDSYAILEASTHLREVEIVIDRIIEQMKKDPTLRAKDICIYAKDINVYRPYLEAVFQDPNVQFSNFISAIFSNQNVSYGFLQLVELGGSAFGLDDLLPLLENPFFQQKVGIDQKEVDEFIQIMEPLYGIGYDRDHLKQYFASIGLQDRFHSQRTLKNGFDHFIKKAIEGDSMQLDLLEKMIPLCHQLYTDLLPIIYDETKTSDQWSSYLTKLMDYFATDEKSDFNALFHSDGPISKLSLRFTSLLPHLKKQLIQNASTYKEGGDFLRCLSFDQGLLPCRGILFLGCSEEQMQSKQTLISSLQSGRSDDHNAYLRQQFIMAQAYASDFFWVSFSKSAGPLANFVKSWIWEMDKKISIDGMRFKDKIFISNLKTSWDLAGCQEKPSNLSFFQCFKKSKEPFYDKLDSIPVAIENLGQIASFLTDPLQSYLQNQGIEKALDLSNELQLSGIQKHQLLQKKIQKEVTEPTFDGRLELLAKKQIEIEMQTIDFQIPNEEVITLQFALNVHEPLQEDRTLVFPAPTTPFGFLEGIWPAATKNELLLLGKNKPRALFRAYPFYLALQPYRSFILTFLQDEIPPFTLEVGQDTIDHFWIYVQNNWHKPSFLYPEILRQICTNDRDGSWKTIQSISYLSIREEDRELFFKWFEENQEQILHAFGCLYEQTKIF